MARQVFFSILGHGTGNTPYRFVTSTPAGGGSEYVPCLLNVPGTISNRLKALDRVGSTSKITVALLFDGTVGSTEVAPLLRADVVPVTDSTGGYVRTSRYHGAGDGTIAVHDSGSISSGYYYINGECVEVTGTTATTLTVTRGRRGTWGQPIPYYAVSGGTPVYASIPRVEGQWCEFGTVSDGVLWRGVIESVELRDGNVVSVTAQSLLGVLRDAEVATPQALRCPSFPALSVTSSGFTGWDTPAGGLLQVDADLYGDPAVTSAAEWAYARISNAEDEWVIVPVSHDSTITVDGQRRALYTVDITSSPTSVKAGGIGSTALEFDVESQRHEHIVRVLRGATRAEYARQVAGANMLAILTALLEANDIAGTSVGLKPSPSGYITSSTSTAGVGFTLPNDWRDAVHYLPSYDGKVIDALFDLYLQPLFVGLSESRGQVALIDWVPDIIETSSPTTINADDAGASGYVFRKRATDALPIVALRQEIIRRGERPVPISLPTASGVPLVVPITEDTETQEVAFVISDFGVSASGLSGLEYTPVIGLAQRFDKVVDRSRLAVDQYDRVLPSVSITLQGTTDAAALRVGELAFISRADMPKPDGTRGASTQRCMVLEISHDLRSDSRSVVVLLLDWYRDAIDAGVWAPCAVVQSWNAGSNTATMEANAYSTSTAAGTLPDSDAQAFADVLTALGASVAVDLIDDEGAHRDSGTLTAATSAKLTVTGLSVTPVAGDRFVIADASTVAASVLSTAIVQGAGPLAFLADSSGDVRGGTQDGRRYS